VASPGTSPSTPLGERAGERDESVDWRLHPVAVPASAFHHRIRRGECRTSHELIGEHPSHTLTDWSPSLQGIAHDRSSWFITNVDGLYRIPAEVDLARSAADAWA
jgi:hypothetical protein